jgi:hypothetical protein
MANFFKAGVELKLTQEKSREILRLFSQQKARRKTAPDHTSMIKEATLHSQ